jgi:hypothetical protein
MYEIATNPKKTSIAEFCSALEKYLNYDICSMRLFEAE